MFECLIPSLGQQVMVRGLTLQDELNVQTTVQLLSGTAYDQMLKIVKIVYECLEIEKEKPLFEDWLNTIAESDLDPLLYGIFHETYGSTLKLQEVCPTNNESYSIQIDLSSLVIDGTVNTENVAWYEKREIVYNNITYRFLSKRTLLATLAALCVSPFSLTDLIRIQNGENPANLNEDILKSIKFSSLTSTIYEIEKGGKVIHRPGLQQLVKIRDWFNITLSDLLKMPRAKFNETFPNDISSPFTTLFSYHVTKCPQCGKKHKIVLDFFRYFWQYSITS